MAEKPYYDDYHNNYHSQYQIFNKYKFFIILHEHIENIILVQPSRQAPKQSGVPPSSWAALCHKCVSGENHPLHPAQLWLLLPQSVFTPLCVIAAWAPSGVLNVK